jgi:general secretion pathway protein M
MNGQGLNLPEGRLGTLLAVAATLLVLAAIWLGAVTPVLGWYEGQADALTTARLEVAHMQALKDSLPALRREVAQSAAQSSGTDVLLDGGSDAIAGANLQATLNDLAAQAGTTLDSAEAVTAQPTGALRRIGVSVSVTATWPVLIAYLAAIDAARPRMVVDDLSVSTNSAPDVRQDVTLQANFTVSAFRAGSAP